MWSGQKDHSSKLGNHFPNMSSPWGLSTPNLKLLKYVIPDFSQSWQQDWNENSASDSNLTLTWYFGLQFHESKSYMFWISKYFFFSWKHQSYISAVNTSEIFRPNYTSGWRSLQLLCGWPVQHCPGHVGILFFDAVFQYISERITIIISA